MPHDCFHLLESQQTVINKSKCLGAVFKQRLHIYHHEGSGLVTLVTRHAAETDISALTRTIKVYYISHLQRFTLEMACLWRQMSHISGLSARQGRADNHGYQLAHWVSSCKCYRHLLIYRVNGASGQTRHTDVWFMTRQIYLEIISL